MVDKIYYINLDHRTDRNEHILKLLNEIGIDLSIVKRISAIFNPNNGALGCSLSHIKVLEEFISSKYETCLIIEDDLDIYNPSNFKDDINKIFINNIDFDIIQISANILKSSDSNYDFLCKIEDSQTTSGYIVNRKFANTLLENFKESANSMVTYNKQHNNCLDIYWKKLQPISKWFCFNPKLGFQLDGYSDIEKRNTNYGC